MSLDNLISVEFTQAEMDEMNTALTSVENILKSKVINLTASQRQQYGRLGDGTENFDSKVGVYAQQKPEIIPFFVDGNELAKDVISRNALTPVLKRLKSLHETVDDTHKLLGWDVYNNVIAIYRNVKMLSKQNVPGINAIYDDLKKQFPHTTKVTGEEVTFETDPLLDTELNQNTNTTGGV